MDESEPNQVQAGGRADVFKAGGTVLPVLVNAAQIWGGQRIKQAWGGKLRVFVSTTVPTWMSSKLSSERPKNADGRGAQRCPNLPYQVVCP